MSVSISTHQPALPLTYRQIRVETKRQGSIIRRRRLADLETQRSTAAPDDLTSRRILRRGGDCADAAARLERAARSETDPLIAAEKHALAVRAHNLSGRPTQIEFNLETGDFRIGYDFIDTIMARLMAKNTTPCQRSEALAMLLVIGRFIRWKTPECVKSLGGLAKYLGVARGHAGRIMRLLESVGAVKWAMRGKAKIIVVNPEGILHAAWDDLSDMRVAYRAAILRDQTACSHACG